MLKQTTADFVRRYPGQASPQVQSTLAKVAVCRTAALGASWHWCADCDTGIRILNSCGDRHCPQCRGATRAGWVNSAMKKVIAGVDYYQVVFTMPDDLSALALGNRRQIFKLLFHAAWESLKQILKDEQQYEAAASMVLHTWNQHLDSHVHLHAVVPGGGPSLTKPGLWKKAVPPPYERQNRWWLVDADDLRYEFRKRFLRGLRRLHARAELKLTGDWSHLKDRAAFEEFLAPLEAKSRVTYIQPPPAESSQPQDIVKYPARYLTGGPISDARLLSYADGKVTFSARTGTTHGGNDETEEVELSAVEFVRRWCLHILPSSFTKTRCFGGWSNHHCRRYVAEGRELLDAADMENDISETVAADETVDDRCQPCPNCGADMELIERVHRTRWRDVFDDDSKHRPAWYRSWESSG